MSMFGGGSNINVHSDVLNANPVDSAEKLKLVEEIKNRAKNSIKYGNFPEAIKLYTKAIELLPDNSILFANRSMCHLSMNNGNDAIEDAKTAVQLDSSYAKAYYRLGAAYFSMNQYKDAKEALVSGLALLPDDKDMLAKLKSVEIAISQNGATITSPKEKVISESKKASVSSEVKSKSVSKPLEVEADNDEIEATDLSKLKGYKKTADGKVTTYFNHELDEKTKSLIGDITPTRIEGSVPIVVPASTTGGSVWNTAGTFESKNFTPWAKEKLTELVSDLKVNIPSKGLTVSVTSIKEVSGDAEIMMNRGKRKFIADFQLVVDWLVADSGQNKLATGTMTVRDINDERDYDTYVAIEFSKDEIANSYVNSHIKAKTESSLSALIYDKFEVFFREFHSK